MRIGLDGFGSLEDGERVDIQAQDGIVTLRKVQPTVTLADLFRGRTPDEWRAEYAGAYDWGPDFGREIVPE